MQGRDHQYAEYHGRSVAHCPGGEINLHHFLDCLRRMSRRARALAAWLVVDDSVIALPLPNCSYLSLANTTHKTPARPILHRPATTYHAPFEIRTHLCRPSLADPTNVVAGSTCSGLGLASAAQHLLVRLQPTRAHVTPNCWKGPAMLCHFPY